MDDSKTMKLIDSKSFTLKDFFEDLVDDEYIEKESDYLYGFFKVMKASHDEALIKGISAVKFTYDGEKITAEVVNLWRET